MTRAYLVVDKAVLQRREIIDPPRNTMVMRAAGKGMVK